MKLDDFLKNHPRIRWAYPEDQEALFSVIDKTALESSSLQISFERRPDFFGFLRAQGERAGVFTFHNQDDSPHGFACLTFRKMRWKGKPVSIGYASDLRTTPKLDREARVQWRKMYGLSIRNSHDIEDFNHAIGFVTAVWHENKAAQKALVSQTKTKDFKYEPVNDYHSYSVWGRWKFWSRPKNLVRRIQPHEVEIVRKTLLGLDQNNSGLFWEEADLLRTLGMFEKSYYDFWVIEEQGRLQAFALDVSQSHLKKLKIKAWPKTLAWAAKLLPLFGKRPVQLNSQVEMHQIVFYRSLQGDKTQNLFHFVDYFWSQNSKKPAEQQFNILNYFSWGSEPIDFQKYGYLSTTVSGSLYKVVSETTHPDFLEIQDFSNLEGNFL